MKVVARGSDQRALLISTDCGGPSTSSSPPSPGFSTPRASVPVTSFSAHLPKSRRPPFPPHPYPCLPSAAVLNVDTCST